MKKPKQLTAQPLPRLVWLPILLSTMTAGGTAFADSTNSIVLPANVDRAFLERLVNTVN
jgi:hypothetical protein